MGKTTTATSSSSGRSYQSSLANTQEAILKNREQFFQDYYLPEFKELYNSMDPQSSAGQAQMGINAQQINASFDAAQKQTDQMLAQRNLGNTGAGAALTAANNRARSSALAQAYATMAANSTNQKATSLANLGNTLMPQTTTAAPMSEEKTSSEKHYGSWATGLI